MQSYKAKNKLIKDNKTKEVLKIIKTFDQYVNRYNSNIKEIMNSVELQNLKESNHSIEEYEEKKILFNKNISFVDFMEKWLLSNKSSVRPNTHDAYMLVFKSSIKHYFKDIALQELSPLDIQEYYNMKLSNNLSACTVLKHHANIHKALDYALSLNLIAYNPADRVILPKKQKFKSNFYNKTQLKESFKCISGDKLEEIIYVTATYG